jgi:hypothetical protein
MNPQSTSFIPQRPSLGQSSKKIVRKVYVFTYLSYVFFFGTLISAFAILAYGYVLDTQLQSEKDRLVTEESRFNDGDIESIKKFDTQLTTATERMNLHLSLLPIFDGLEQSISQKLELKSFTYTRENDSAPKMEITGNATVLNSLAFQREVLTTVPLFSGAKFTQVTIASAPPKDEDTDIVDPGVFETTIPFWLGKTVDVSLLQYRPTINAEISNTEDTESSVAEEGDVEDVATESDVPEEVQDGVIEQIRN